MAHWGKCDFRELKALQQRIEKLAQQDYDAFCRAAAKELAARLLAKVQRGTPVIFGDLRRSWTMLPIIKRGAEYKIIIINNKNYASYVEYGHRQQPGRFIPGYWEGVGSGQRFVYDPDAKSGMVLKDGWVKGKHMLTISEAEIDAAMPGILERKLNALLKEVFQ